jgi:glycosyltransferase involved in cell wall biosynthesis
MMQTDNIPTISIVIPAYNEESNIVPIRHRLAAVLEPYGDYEILFVDDGSNDATLYEIEKIVQTDPRIKYLSFSRNFGHQKALRAGLDHAAGKCAITLDADLQHPPELIPKMVERWKEGYEVVSAVRENSSDLSWFKRKTSESFYKLINYLSSIEIRHGAADFRLMDRAVLDVFRQIKEEHLFFRGMISWIGFKQCFIPYQEEKRLCGKSKYSLKKMVLLALDGITSFSVRPLHLTTLFGGVVSLTSFLYGLFAISAALFTDKVISGWTSMIISILFLGGIQLLMLGIVGEYLGKLFIESKHRPAYIIKKSNVLK